MRAASGPEPVAAARQQRLELKARSFLPQLTLAHQYPRGTLTPTARSCRRGQQPARGHLGPGRAGPGLRGGPAPGPCRAAPAGAEGGVGRRLPPPRGLGGGLVLAAIRVPSPARRCPAGAAGGGPVPPGPAPSPASSPGVPRARRRRRPGGRRARTGRGPRGAARSAPPLPLGPVPPGERGGRAGSWTSRHRRAERRLGGKERRRGPARGARSRWGPTSLLGAGPGGSGSF